ncbi:hypothetical protein T492DRAFT_352730 [Pavlovales sp. CCMP2436]|nr:hypothetical protein T492DRAFT_352730 [Pavlovales sp. CCMP2436]
MSSRWPSRPSTSSIAMLALSAGLVCWLGYSYTRALTPLATRLRSRWTSAHLSSISLVSLLSIAESSGRRGVARQLTVVAARQSGGGPPRGRQDVTNLQ